MIKIKNTNIEFLIFENMHGSSLVHFSTLKHGGVSQGNYASLNLGNLSDDRTENVIQNRKILAAEFGLEPQSLFIPKQTHSSNICIIDRHFLSLTEDRQRIKLDNIDALVTSQKNVIIGVTTADCVPILLYDNQKKVLAAIHAGWRGTVAYISQKVVKVMRDEFGCNARDIIAGIGPSISPSHFEVGDEVGESFDKSGFPMQQISFRNPKTQKLHIDLWEANKYSLLEIGLLSQNIEIAKLCTYSDEDNFFSARRQTIHSGRMLTGGVLRD